MDNGTELAFAGIAAQADHIRDGTLSSTELVRLYLDRIERLDPRLNAFRVVMGDQALAAAADADRRIAAGEMAPLLGVPVAIKDEVDMSGHVAMHGTAGFEEPADADAEQVRRLRIAGAVVIGTTNLPELAICGFTETDAHGITRNPWNPAHTPGGSSGGSAVAVAAGLVGAASASDGAGSIRIPAANCGLFGLKPQRGRISLAPESQHWYGLSVAGCMSRRVRDTALWLDVVAGPHPGDAHTAESIPGTYSQAATRAPGALRVALSTAAPRALAPPIVSATVKAAVGSIGQMLEDLGHHVEERDPDYGSIANGIVPRYLAGIAQHFSTIPEPDRLESRTRGFARMGELVPDRVLAAALAGEAEHAARINGIFDHVDLLVTPVAGTPPVEVGHWAGHGALRTLVGMSRVYPYTAVWNHTGQPAASVPAGFTDTGLPVGVMLIAPPHREDRLLSVAAQLEAALDWPAHRPPEFVDRCT